MKRSFQFDSLKHMHAKVAVKLIRKDTVGVSETRRSRVEREIHALRVAYNMQLIHMHAYI